MKFKVSMAQLITPVIEREPNAFSNALGRDPINRLDAVERLRERLDRFRDTFSVDEPDDEHAMHVTYGALAESIGDSRASEQSFQLSELNPDCCQPVKDENGKIVGHLAIGSVVRGGSIAYSKPDGSFAVASVLLGIIPADGEAASAQKPASSAHKPASSDHHH